MLQAQSIKSPTIMAHEVVTNKPPTPIVIHDVAVPLNGNVTSSIGTNHGATLALWWEIYSFFL